MTGSERNILVVDDDQDSRTIAADVLRMLGFSVHEAPDGESGLRALAEASFDLVVLDYMLPGLSGPEVCAKIKSVEGGSLVPVLMLTARTDIKDKVSALEGGADDYLTKPYHFQELQARTKAWLRVRDLNVALREKNEELERVQSKLVQQERQLAALQIAGTAAHQLGQPLSAIVLNCHLLEAVPSGDARAAKALSAIKNDANRMAAMIEGLKRVDASKTESYHGGTKILELGSNGSAEPNKSK